MNKLIITGANGFIGTALLKLLASKEMKIFALVRDVDSDTSDITDLLNVEIVYCNMKNIADLPQLIYDRDIDICIHLAWSGSFGDARADYGQQLLNVRYTLDLINVVSRMGIKRFVGAGTLAEKDVMNYHNLDGSSPNAVSIYGIAKLAAHFMSKTECNKLGMEHIWCFLSNTYGVGNTTNNFINMASKQMLSGERASFTAGEQIYDFVYISDTVKAIYNVSYHEKNNKSYYLGSTRERPLKEYIRMIRDAIDPGIELHLGEVPFNGRPLPEKEYSTFNMVKDTGFIPEILFEDGIKITVEWLKQVLDKRKKND